LATFQDNNLKAIYMYIQHMVSNSRSTIIKMYTVIQLAVILIMWCKCASSDLICRSEYCIVLYCIFIYFQTWVTFTVYDTFMQKG